VLTVIGGIGGVEPDAPLAGTAAAGAPAPPGAAPALLPPPGADSLLPQAASSTADNPKQILAFRKEYERVFFIFK
jgi:hypothetical protein